MTTILCGHLATISILEWEINQVIGQKDMQPDDFHAMKGCQTLKYNK